MVLVRLETQSRSSASETTPIVPSREAMRLLARGKLGSKLVSLAQTAAAVHRARTAQAVIAEARQ